MLLQAWTPVGQSIGHVCYEGMNDMTRTRVIQPAETTFIRVATPELQRKCRCGTHTSGSDKCPKCKQENWHSALESRLIPRNDTMSWPGEILDVAKSDFPEPRFGHDFSHVKLRSSVRGFADKTQASHQRIQELDTEEEMVGDVQGTFEVPCNGFAASSVCNPGNGDYEITSNTDTCCSRPCSQQHEERHASDLRGCCWLLHDNILNHTADRDVLVQQYNDWMNSGAKQWSECNAYGVSVACAQKLLASNKCSRESTQCCKDLQFYRTEMEKQRRAYCENAPTTRPPCPFRPAPGPRP